MMTLLGLKDPDGNTFLHVSVLDEVPELVYYFLIKGIKPTSQNNDGDTPLHLAIRNHNNNIIDILLQFGAKVDICNKMNENSVNVASVKILY